METLNDLPIDLHNEQVILGNALNFKEHREYFAINCEWNHFLEKKHKVIAWCIIRMMQKELEINDDSFIIVLNDYPDIYERSYGGNRYLSTLRRLCPTENGNFEQHVKKLNADYVKSTVCRDGIVRIVQGLSNPKTTIQELEAMLEQVKVSVTQNKPIEIDFVYGEGIFTSYVSTLQRRADPASATFITSGFDNLDELMTEGFAKRNISVIAGFTGMAKSSFIHNMCVRQSSRGYNVGIVSLEMVMESVIDRMVSLITNIPLINIIKSTHKLTDAEKRLITDCIANIRDNEKIMINDRVKSTLDYLDQQLLLLKKLGKPLDILYIDLFGKLDDVSVEAGLQTNIEHKLRLCRDLGRKHDVHISCAVQIKRYFDMNSIRPNKPTPRPKLDKIKNSGAFAEEADVVFLLHREKYYKPELPYDIVEIDIAKQRQGGMNALAYMEFEADITRMAPTDLRPDV